MDAKQDADGAWTSNMRLFGRDAEPTPPVTCGQHVVMGWLILGTGLSRRVHYLRQIKFPTAFLIFLREGVAFRFKKV
jgi:hypothetical protein